MDHVSVDAHPRRPSRLLLVNVDLVGEGIRALGGDGRDVIFVGIRERDDLHGCGQEGLLHRPADFGSFYK